MNKWQVIVRAGFMVGTHTFSSKKHASEFITRWLGVRAKILPDDIEGITIIKTKCGCVVRSLIILQHSRCNIDHSRLYREDT